MGNRKKQALDLVTPWYLGQIQTHDPLSAEVEASLRQTSAGELDATDSEATYPPNTGMRLRVTCSIFSSLERDTTLMRRMCSPPSMAPHAASVLQIECETPGDSVYSAGHESSLSPECCLCPVCRLLRRPDPNWGCGRELDGRRVVA